MSHGTEGSGGTLRAGTAFLAVAGLLAAAHAGVEGRPTGPAPTSGLSGRASDAPAATPVQVRREVHLMGTVLEGRAWAGDREAGLAGLEAAFEAVEREEALLSTWREDTELARLNAAEVGTPVRVSARLHGLLQRAWRISRETGGAFDPVVGPLVDAWDLRGEGRRPSSPELEAARRASGRPCFELGAGRSVTRRCEGAWIDPGAFGKGSALARARRALEEAGVRAALLDFGGQLLAVGAPPGEGAWPAAVAHPARRDSGVVGLRLRDRSAATTSASERFVVVDGEVRGHVLDPRTGRPAPAWGSVTVVAGDPLRADALSTALFVLGPEAGWRWARGREDVGVLLLGLERGSPGAGRADAGRASDGAGGSRDAERAPGGVVACWNDAMERYLDVGSLRRRCGTMSAGRAKDDGASRSDSQRGEQREADVGIRSGRGDERWIDHR